MNEFRLRRGVATSEMVIATQRVLSLLQVAGANTALPSAHFMMGFLLLWSGNPQGALEPLQIALTAAEQTGDFSLQARCLTYLAIAQRLNQRVDEVERAATHSLAMATIAHMPEYIGTAQANLSWLAWRSGNFEQARQYGYSALEAWRQLPTGHGSTLYQWTALCPLIALALDAGDIANAIDHVHQLLDPLQLRLPDALTALFEQACLAWKNNASESARLFLQEATALAQQLHYL